MAVLLKPCGTWAAYKRHLYHRQVPCEDCRRASSARNARQRYKEPQLERDIRELVHLIATAMGEGRRL